MCFSPLGLYKSARTRICTSHTLRHIHIHTHSVSFFVVQKKDIKNCSTITVIIVHFVSMNTPNTRRSLCQEDDNLEDGLEDSGAAADDMLLPFNCAPAPVPLFDEVLLVVVMAAVAVEEDDDGGES